MSVEWALSTVVPFFKEKGYIRNRCCYTAVKLFEHGMKVVEREGRKRFVE